MPEPEAPYAVLADLHGNEEAARTVLDYLDRAGAATVYCLGDLVGYGQGSAWCVAEARRRGWICLQGNHDAQVRPPRNPALRPAAQLGLDLAAQQLSDDDVAWLSALPAELTSKAIGAVLVHGALTGRDDYILGGAALAENEARLLTRPERMLFFGHSHLPMVVGAGRRRLRFPATASVALEAGEKYLVNPGSVGQPRDDHPEASFVLVHPAERRLELVRLAYDVAAEQARMRRARLPENSWRRLAVGR